MQKKSRPPVRPSHEPGCRSTIFHRECFDGLGTIQITPILSHKEYIFEKSETSICLNISKNPQCYGILSEAPTLRSKISQTSRTNEKAWLELPQRIRKAMPRIYAAPEPPRLDSQFLDHAVVHDVRFAHARSRHGCRCWRLLWCKKPTNNWQLFLWTHVSHLLHI